MKRARIDSRLGTAGIIAAATLLFLASGCRRHPPGTFATPEEAVAAFDGLVGAGDERRSDELFGPESLDLFRSGDEAEDRAAAQRVKELIAEKIAFDEIDEDTQVALFGESAWPFPIPLVREEGRWRFDTEAGREELLNRRIGYLELSTLASLHAYVEAQFEYAAEGRDGNPPAFAQRFRSSPGTQDGLYWPEAEGEPESPLGDLLAEAALERPADEPRPFHGYHYRILTGQGGHAPGGERSYLNAKGLMTGGFAVVAWPAKYGNSGIVTFMTSSRGMVFQKDLGPETAELAAAIASFDPDPTWMPTADSLARVEDEDEGEATDGEDAQ